MKGPLAIEKSNFLIEPIDTPFSSRLSTDHCCCSGADTGESECRVMTLPRFPCSEPIDMDTDVLCRLDEEREDEKGLGTRGRRNNR